MAVELFAEGEPTGRLLLLQIKGHDAFAPQQNEEISVDMSVKHLRRCERFATPILLVWVPIQDEERRAWYLWVQSYVRVVLDHEKPGWRQQTKVRLRIPMSNVLGLPDNESTLVWIAGDPMRAAAFGQLSRLAHEARWALDDPLKLRSIFSEALALESIFGDRTWHWGQFERTMVLRGLRACELILANQDPTDQQLRDIGCSSAESWDPGDTWLRSHLLKATAEHSAELLSTAVALYYDDRLRHTNWQFDRGHDF